MHLNWQDRAKSEEEALRLLEEHEIDFIVLARIMKILSPNFVWRRKSKIINIHPSLLPSFPGPQAYRQAYESGIKIGGVTAHFVSMRLDEGPIIAQGSFDITPGMELRDIIAQGQTLEAGVLVKAVKLYLGKRLDVYWGGRKRGLRRKQALVLGKSASAEVGMRSADLRKESATRSRKLTKGNIQR